MQIPGSPERWELCELYVISWTHSISRRVKGNWQEEQRKHDHTLMYVCMLLKVSCVCLFIHILISFKVLFLFVRALLLCCLSLNLGPLHPDFHHFGCAYWFFSALNAGRAFKSGYSMPPYLSGVFTFDLQKSLILSISSIVWVTVSVLSSLVERVSRKNPRIRELEKGD